jgi:hypothetical protein
MKDSDAIPQLTEEQQQALDAGNGVVQGPSYVLMRTDVVLDWFGYTKDELRRELQPAIEQVASGDVAEWNLDKFLAKMHKGHAAKTK